jgi:hypothetical protein
MSRARDLSRLSNQTNFTPDVATGRVGLGSENPTAKLNVAGIVSATAFYGDGSNLEGVSGSGIGTALADEGVNSLVYYADKILGIVENTTIDVPDTSDSNVAYTKYAEVSVSDGIDLIIADGDDFIPDILGISSDVQVPGVLAGNGGRVRADNFSNKAGTGAPNFPSGLTGTTGSFTGNVSVGGVLTYEDVTNIDSIGIITARSDVSIADKIIHTGDTDTAIRFPAADTFTVETGGSERVRVDSSGRLLVGTNSAFDGGTSTLLQVESTGGARIALSRNDTTTAENDSIGRIRWYGNDSDGGYDECARIEVIANADHASNSKPSALTFHTTASSAESSTERLRIDSSGRVGVGRNPSYKLDVQDVINIQHDGSNIGKLQFSGTGTRIEYSNATGNLSFYTNSTERCNVGYNGGFVIKSGGLSLTGGGDIAFNSDGIFKTDGTERLRIRSNGNVGIATVLPGNALHVFKSGDGQTPVLFETSNTTGKLRFYNDSNGWSIDSEGDLRFVGGRSGSGAPVGVQIYADNSIRLGADPNINGTVATDGTGFRFNYGSGFWWATAGANSYWNTKVNTQLNFRRNGSQVGSININSTSTSYSTSSDYRLKENVVDLDGAITRVKQLAPKRFNFIVDADRTVDGFLAHEAQTVVPEAVTGTKDEVNDDGESVIQGIDQSKLVPLLTAALQEAITKIETLETKVTALEAG